MKKYLCFASLIFLLAGCATTTVDMKASSRSFGDETVSLVKQGKYTIACADAKFMADMFTADNYALVAFMANLADDYISKKGINPNDKKKIDQYAEVLDRLAGKLESKYKNYPKVMALISQSIFDKEINSMIEASMTAYLGLIKTKDFYEFVAYNYCGMQPTEGYISPLSITPEEIKAAFERKMNKNSKTQKPVTEKQPVKKK